MFYLYHHINPVTEEVFYVGIAGRKDRATYFSNRNKFWKSYVAKHGKPIVRIVATFDALQDAIKAEISEISKYGRRTLNEPNATLVNMADGGSLNSGWKHSIDTVERIRKRMAKRPTTDVMRRRMLEDNPAKRLEVIEKIRASKLGKKRDAETIRKMSENASSKRPEVAAKISEALKGRTGHLHCRSVQVSATSKDGRTLIFHGISEAARQTGSDFRLISACCRGKRKSHNGYVWRYH